MKTKHTSFSFRLCQLAELLRYHTSKSGDEQISLTLGLESGASALECVFSRLKFTEPDVVSVTEQRKSLSPEACGLWDIEAV